MSPCDARRMRGPSLITLRRAADALAKLQGQNTSTGHVLAAVASKPGPGAELLAEWRLGPDVLIQAARVLVDDQGDAVESSMRRACALSASPTGVHLLAALFEERGAAAFRCIDQCGALKLRAVVMQMTTTRGRTSRTAPALDGRLIPASILRDLVD